ncbi:MAG: hypothetical protein ACOX9R_08320 [Armatimonadota bacterium]|jgi:hypothetical protein
MHTRELGPVNEYLPEIKSQGTILVVSDYRLLNLGHASALCKAGYSVYTAITCSDVPRVFDRFKVGSIDMVVFASLVHGWHHWEGEERPPTIPPKTDVKWHTRNFAEVVETIVSRQAPPPKVMIAYDLIKHDCYDINEDALAAAGVKYETYSANNPRSLPEFLTAQAS